MFLKYFTSILDYIRHLFSHRASAVDDNAGVPLRARSLGGQEIVARRTRLNYTPRHDHHGQQKHHGLLLRMLKIRNVVNHKS